MIELDSVTKVYDKSGIPAVDDLSLHINKGEICVFLGPSGCGKSTTLRMINRMIDPTLGTIKIDGKDIKHSDPDRLRMGIGYVIQQIGLLPHKTIEENIAVVPRLYGWDKDKIKNRVTELLELIGLDPEVERYKKPSQLSGGQMQRIGVARALACEPPIMLMDEPFGAVDPIARTNLQNEFLKIQRKMKTTICFVTHDIDEAIKMGDKIAIFNKGKIVQYDTPTNILSNPVNEFVKNFIGEHRIIKNLSLFKVKDIVIKINNNISSFESLNSDIKITTDSDKKIITSLDCSLQNLLSSMIENNVDYVSVVDNNKILGYVSFKDIREYINGKEE